MRGEGSIRAASPPTPHFGYRRASAGVHDIRSVRSGSIARYKLAYLSWKAFLPCVYFGRRHSSIGVIIPCGVCTGGPFVTIVSPVIVTYRMRIAPLSAGAEAFST